MESVALTKVITLFILYFIVGLLPILAVASSKVVSRFDCLAWGGVLIYLAAFMLVPLTEVQSLTELYVNKGCEFNVAVRECKRYLTEQDYADLKLFNQYVMLLTFLFTLTIGGTGVNLFSQGVAGRGSFISQEAETKLKQWLERIEETQTVQFYLLVGSLVLSLVSLFTVGIVVAFIS
ncbi:hypothetical protein BCU92_02580 [Vibrio cyclitrophicus]|uniref:hypothetical protein n=1 Tax=Vibrio cyclitrophicus TaxID=47951 RepID=UPI000C8257AD|nr:MULTISPECIES: hypothetical protein [Vibrio]PMG39248.1 hypothetical protein BCU92_18465 [Vibrio cyclitrophicus]PMH60265.1 hypothetical protein BCU64_19350 [Vibrio lentus]